MVLVMTNKKIECWARDAILDKVEIKVLFKEQTLGQRLEH